MEFNQVIMLIIILIVIISVFPICSCCRSHGVGLTEGFAGISELSDYNIQKKPVNTSSWFSPSLVYNKKHPSNKSIQAIMNRPNQPIPLPKDELLIFATTPFKPECCPSTFSTSTGCWCGTSQDYNYLVTRGGNNVPYSEY